MPAKDCRVTLRIESMLPNRIAISKVKARTTLSVSSEPPHNQGLRVRSFCIKSLSQSKQSREFHVQEYLPITRWEFAATTTLQWCHSSVSPQRQTIRARAQRPLRTWL